MKDSSFNYEDVFMGVMEEKPRSYFRSFNQDYRLRSIVQNLTIRHGRFLDVGCGGGILTESLRYYFPKLSIYGVDVSRTAIRYAKKRGSGKITYARIIKKRLPFESNFFDTCICLDVLEHVPDVHFFLDEINRVLKKNGQLFLIVPCEGQPFTITWLLQKIRIGDGLTRRFFGHIHPEFTHARVKDLLAKHKFRVIKVSFSEHLFYQMTHFIIFSLPKIALEVLLGTSKASEYTDSSIIRSPKKNSDVLMIVRSSWFALFNFMMMYPMNWETRLLKNVSWSAWKLNALVKKV